VAPGSPQALSPGSSSGESSAAFAASAKNSLDAELALLDGGPLTQSLSQTAKRGVALRVILDPAERSSREEGRALQAAFQPLSPGTRGPLELRWRPFSGRPERRLLADAQRLARWEAGGSLRRDDPQAAGYGRLFEGRWAQALSSLPEALNLEDQLKALPDPRDKDPHLSRRKDAASGE
jgi:hypothetical protein